MSFQHWVAAGLLASAAIVSTAARAELPGAASLPESAAPPIILAQAQSNRQAIVESYRIAFGREPQPGEVQWWEGQGRLSVDQMVARHRDYMKQDEGSRRDSITRSYQATFGRPPQPGELTYWNDRIRQSGETYNDMVNMHRQYIAQQQRAAPAPTPQPPAVQPAPPVAQPAPPPQRPAPPVAQPTPPAPPAPSPSPPVAQPTPGGGPLQAIPVGPVLTSTLPNNIKASNSHVEGLANVFAGSEAPIKPDQAVHAAAFLRGYEALVNQLTNPASLAEIANDDGTMIAMLDPAIAEQIISDSGLLERHRAFSDAMLHSAWLMDPANVSFESSFLERSFAIITDDAGGGVMTIRPRQKINWTAYDRIERVILLLQLASAAQTASDISGVISEATGAMEKAIEQYNLESVPVPQAQAIIKFVGVVAALNGVADIMAKAAIAFTPNTVTRLYANIDGKPWKSGDAPITIKKGVRTPIKVYIQTGTPGGRIMTPYEVATMVAGKIMGMKKIDDWINNGAAKKAAEVVKRDASLVTEAQRANKLRELAASIAKEDKAKFDLRKEVFENVKKRIEKFAGMAYNTSSTFKAWADRANAAFDIPAFENLPDEVTSNRVLHMHTLSPALVKVVQGGKGQFFLEGVHEGQQAGYFFGLKKDIITRIAASNTRLSEKGVVNVGAEKPPAPPKIRYCGPREYHGICLNNNTCNIAGNHAALHDKDCK